MNLEKVYTEDLIQELLNRGFIRVLWSREDVISAAERNDITITEDEVLEVIERIEQTFDANIGVNWDVISYNISKVKNK